MKENQIIIYVSLMAKDGTVWMNQNQLAELFATTKQNISLHIQNILKEGELDELSVVKEYLTGTQFRIWANRNLKEYMVKG
nr:hypothetical protein [Lebetimonas sp. JH292]